MCEIRASRRPVRHMNDRRRTHLSKFLGKHLRHTPEAIGIALGVGGWVAVDNLQAASERAGVRFTLEELDKVVRASDKQRFAFDESGTKIRANQGHSRTWNFNSKPPSRPLCSITVPLSETSRRSSKRG